MKQCKDCKWWDWSGYRNGRGFEVAIGACLVPERRYSLFDPDDSAMFDIDFGCIQWEGRDGRD